MVVVLRKGWTDLILGLDIGIGRYESKSLDRRVKKDMRCCYVRLKYIFYKIIHVFQILKSEQPKSINK